MFLHHIQSRAQVKMASAYSILVNYLFGSDMSPSKTSPFDTTLQSKKRAPNRLLEWCGRGNADVLAAQSNGRQQLLLTLALLITSVVVIISKYDIRSIRLRYRICAASMLASRSGVQTSQPDRGSAFQTKDTEVRIQTVLAVTQATLLLQIARSFVSLSSCFCLRTEQRGPNNTILTSHLRSSSSPCFCSVGAPGPFSHSSFIHPCNVSCTLQSFL